MRGILAVSVTKVMSTTTPDEVASGFLAGEKITLTAIDDDNPIASAQWCISVPQGVRADRARLIPSGQNSVTFTPEKGCNNIYVVTAKINYSELFVLRIDVSSVSSSVSFSSIRLQDVTESQVPTPISGATLFFDDGDLKIKYSDGSVGAVDVS